MTDDTSSLDDTGTITTEIRGAEERDFTLLWHFYYARTERLASRNLGPADAVESEDVAIQVLESVFRSLDRKKEEGKLGDLNREVLWGVIVQATRHKLIDRHRRNSAKRRSVNTLGRTSLVADLVSTEPSPEEILVFEEQISALFKSLACDQLRTIARMRLDGCEIAEIAEELDLSTRSVLRKLKRVHETWREFLLTYN